MQTTNIDNNQIVSNLLETMVSTIKEIGILNTILVLENGKDKSNNFERKDILWAIECVCAVFNMPPETLFSPSKKYPRKYAFGIWAYLCDKHLLYSPKDLAKISGKSRATIYKSTCFIRKYPKASTNAFEQKIIEKINESENNLKLKLNKN